MDQRGESETSSALEEGFSAQAVWSAERLAGLAVVEMGHDVAEVEDQGGRSLPHQSSFGNRRRWILARRGTPLAPGHHSGPIEFAKGTSFRGWQTGNASVTLGSVSCPKRETVEEHAMDPLSALSRRS